LWEFAVIGAVILAGVIADAAYKKRSANAQSRRVASIIKQLEATPGDVSSESMRQE